MQNQNAEYDKADFRIGVLTEAISAPGFTGTSDLIELAKHFSPYVYLVTSPEAKRFFEPDKRVRAYSIYHRASKNPLIRILRDAFYQVKISYKLSTIMREVDVWLFYIGGDYLVLPMLITKLLGRSIILVCAGSASEILFFQENAALSIIARFLARVNFTLSDRIVIYSSVFADKWNLECHHDKVTVAPRHILDFSQLSVKNQFEHRAELVGYVGRLSEEKGALNFVRAIPLIRKQKESVKFLIVGDGPLSTDIAEYLASNGLHENVSVAGWVEHDMIADYLNQLKLLVMPSYTEGLPNIMLEAMACGVPVLATAAGGIADVVKDGETGYIIEKNTPECIAANVVRAIDDAHLNNVADRARAFVREEFSGERIMYNWAAVFSALGDTK